MLAARRVGQGAAALWDDIGFHLRVDSVNLLLDVHRAGDGPC